MPTIVPTHATTPWRLLVLVGGLACVGSGVALTIQADLGVAPYDVLSTGIADLFRIPIGVAAIILPVLFLGIGIALGGRIGVGSVLAVFLVGPILGTVLGLLPEVTAMVPRLALFASGFAVIAVGITLVIVPEIGPAPAELVMLAIHERGHSLAPVRTGIEVISVAIGWAMGGEVGAGTIVFALLIGPALRVTLMAAGYDSARATEASDAAAPGA